MTAVYGAAGHRQWIGVRTKTGTRIHWYSGEAFDGSRLLHPGEVACGLWLTRAAVDRDYGHFGPRLDDYCAKCLAAVLNAGGAA